MHIIYRTDIQPTLKLNLKIEGIKLNSAYLMMKISNTDSFVTKYEQRAIKILSKLYTIFHSEGIIYQGDIFTGKDVILWKEDREVVNAKFRFYVYKLRK